MSSTVSKQEALITLHHVAALNKPLYPQERSRYLVLGTYVPKRLRRTASAADIDYTLRILRLKWRKPDVLEYFFDLLNPILPPSVPIVTIPSHDVRQTQSGIRTLAQRLAAHHNRFDATSCLVRYQNTPEMRKGIPRSEGMHFRSIRVANPDLIAGRPIILLDDVITSGCSMRACKSLLLAAGATSVSCVSLSKTIQFA